MSNVQRYLSGEMSSKGIYKQKRVRVSNAQRSLSEKAISKGTYKA